ncbi:MAG TPA: NADP-dependent oxidoreductase, partial [Acidimicrobiales bacterium]|nr:NADP-dependent oxidoreductase [Acidimicrobiales bacterium]
EALVRVRYLSIDPTIRTWMNDAPGYLPPIGIGEVVRSGGIGEVVRSRSDRYREGDLVVGMVGWQDHALAGPGSGMQALPPGVDPLAAINVFGVTGMTAWFGLLEVGTMRPGDVVVVSGAAGATGSSAAQIAKAKGAAKVIGIAGGGEKCRYLLEELGLDAAIDYKSERVAARLREEAPEGVDLYFDNVGGEILNAVLGNLAMRGRVVLCGAISAYNATSPPPGPSNYVSLITRRGRMEGFIILDYSDRFPEAQAGILALLSEGRLRHVEHVVEGLEHAPEALNLLFTGGNTGKVVVKL